MRLENITLKHFKNYEDLALNFSNDIICFVGENGSGKTNLLDAIHYLSLSKSAFNAIDSQNIQHGQDFFAVRGTFLKHEKKYKVHCSLQRKQKKLLKLNDKPYSKFTEHVGKFPTVLINPNDTDLIREGSEIRRKFIDSIIAQTNQLYLSQLVKYNHALKQRNALLKQINEQKVHDHDLLIPFDEILLSLANAIYKSRKEFVGPFVKCFESHYQHIAGSKEAVTMNYQTDVEKESFAADFRSNVQKDIVLSRTGMGTHKDDFIFLIDGYPIKKFGSQGQQKSFIIALKLAQFDFIKTMTDVKPILLLDDIFDKLDDVRINKLLTMLADDIFGQIFVTDARPERTASIFAQITNDLSTFEIKNGQVND